LHDSYGTSLGQFQVKVSKYRRNISTNPPLCTRVLARADSALLSAKREGRNRTITWTAQVQ
jgi:GGDEF domain-containing protein